MTIRSEPYSYCTNSFFCEDPFNAIDAIHCTSCNANLLVGGRYRLVGFLEKSNIKARSRVYKAIDTWNDNEKFVIKIIDYPDKKLASYLRREYEFLRSVSKPFLQVEESAYFEWLPDPENDFYTTYVLALPWIEGKDSLDWIKENGPISESQCVDWIFQILDYLEILSEMSTMHRDIKPENVIVTSDKSIQLIDFGSIRRVDEDYVSILEGTVFNQDGTQRRGTRIFTFGYSPPEQLVGRAVLQSDFYALGKTGIYWLTGRTPADLIEEDIDDWFEGYPNISQTFIRFIDWLTSQKAAQRPVNANAIRQYLEDRYHFDLEGENLQKQRNLLRNPKLYALAGVVVLSLIGFWFSLSQALYQQGLEAVNRTQYEKAREKFNAALRVNWFHGEAFYNLGLACFKDNDKDCAEKNFKKSLKWIWNTEGPLYQLGVLAESKSNFDVARKYYKASIDSYERNPESYNRLARLELSQDQLGKAQDYVELGLKFTVDDDMKVRLLNQQGRIFYERKEWEKAEQVLSQANSIENTAESACLLPEIKKELGEPQIIVDTLWETCFFAPSQYPEGNRYKEELLKRALPSLFPKG